MVHLYICKQRIRKWRTKNWQTNTNEVGTRKYSPKNDANVKTKATKRQIQFAYRLRITLFTKWIGASKIWFYLRSCCWDVLITKKPSLHSQKNDKMGRKCERKWLVKKALFLVVFTWFLATLHTICCCTWQQRTGITHKNTCKTKLYVFYNADSLPALLDHRDLS